jgi:hypothetical protein
MAVSRERSLRRKAPKEFTSVNRNYGFGRNRANLGLVLASGLYSAGRCVGLLRRFLTKPVHVTAKMLEGVGVRANLAGNGREALHMFKPLPYDTILIDRRMPELDVLRRWFPAKTTEREHPAIGSLSEG